jgi:multiple sugar transport system permease protein
MGIGRFTQKTFIYVLLIAGLIIVAFPLVWVVTSSFKAGDEVFAYPPTLVPEDPRLDNYITLFTDYPFLRWLGNSFIVAFAVTGLSLVLHSMAGYALARLRFPGRNTLFLIIMSTYMLPIYAILVPRFLVVKQLGWVNSYEGLIIPSVFHAFGIFAFRQFFLGIPKELEDAALIDGASRVRIFIEIVLPLSRAIFLTMAVIFFIANWDAFIWPLIVARSKDLWVAQVGIASFRDPQITFWELVVAASTVTIAPSLLLFLALQRYIVRGIATTGIRG